MITKTFLYTSIEKYIIVLASIIHKMLFKSHLLLKYRYRPEMYKQKLAGKINKPGLKAIVFQ